MVRELTERLQRFNIRTFRALHQRQVYSEILRVLCRVQFFFLIIFIFLYLLHNFRRYDSTQHDELILKVCQSTLL